MPFFYGIHPENPKIKVLFDLARLILQPDFARKTHVTLRGPYNKRPPSNSKWLGRKISPVILTRPSQFFNDFQNTVFLRVIILDESDLIWKPDYPDAVLHLSIYDGADRKFAWQVLNTLRDFPWSAEFDFSPITVIEKKHNFEENFFISIDELDSAFDLISEKPMTREYIKDMHPGQRLFFLRKLCQLIHDQNRIK